jgi:uncharacterized membrane protein YoaK (UPF0700 family)
MSRRGVPGAWGQRLAAAFTGGGRWDWTPYFLLWAGLVLGAALGAVAYNWIGLQAIWFAAGAALVLTGVLGRIPA